MRFSESMCCLLQENLEKTTAGNVALLNAELAASRWNDARRRSERLIFQDPSDEPKVTAVDLGTLILNWFIVHAPLEQVDALIKSDNFKALRLRARSQRKATEHQVALAQVAIAHGDLSGYESMAESQLPNHPCAEFALLANLRAMSRTQKIQLSTNPKLLELMFRSYARLEGMGIAHFIFFEDRATLEARAGNYYTAIAYHETALQYEGEPRWALLNAGTAALQAKEFELARDKFRLSINLEPLPASVYGLLFAVGSMIGTEREYLELFSKYPYDMLRLEYAKRNELEVHALIVSCKVYGKLPGTSALLPGEMIKFADASYKRNQFNPSTCRFSGRRRGGRRSAPAPRTSRPSRRRSYLSCEE